MRETDQKIVFWNAIWLLTSGLASLLPYLLWMNISSFLVIAVIFGVALIVLPFGNMAILTTRESSGDTASGDDERGAAWDQETVHGSSRWQEYFRPTLEEEYKKTAKKIGIPSILLVVSSHVLAWRIGADTAIVFYLAGLVILGAWFAVKRHDRQ